MSTPRAPRHLLRIEDLSREEILTLLEDAHRLKQARRAGGITPHLAGRTLALVFDKASTRTRVSFEVGMVDLGGFPLFISRGDSQLSRGESPADTAKVLSRFVHGMVVRTHAHAIIEEMARNSLVPVINGLTNLRHPCQVLSNLFTLHEVRGTLDGLEVAWVGDGNNMANSWIAAAMVMGFGLRLACPEGYDPDPALLQSAKAAGARVRLVRQPAEAVEGAHAVNTDVWASMGQEAEARKRAEAFKGWCVDERLMGLAAEGAVFMHCLPAHRGEEVTDGVLDGPRSVVIEQAENRLHMGKAVLRLCLSA